MASINNSWINNNADVKPAASQQEIAIESKDEMERNYSYMLPHTVEDIEAEESRIASISIPSGMKH